MNSMRKSHTSRTLLRRQVGIYSVEAEFELGVLSHATGRKAHAKRGGGVKIPGPYFHKGLSHHPGLMFSWLQSLLTYS